VKKLAAGGMKISPEIRAHLSPLQWEHINFHGKYSFAPMPPADPAEGIKPTRQLRDPDARDEDDEEFAEAEAL
jgi:hypothetical protein